MIPPAGAIFGAGRADPEAMSHRRTQPIDRPLAWSIANKGTIMEQPERRAATLRYLSLPIVALLSVAQAPLALAQQANAPSPSTRPALEAYLNTLAGQYLGKRAAAIASIRTKADIARRQEFVRTTLLKLLGGLPSDRPPLAVRVTNTLVEDGFRIETVIFDSEPGQPITADLFIPSSAGQHPAVILSPGHGPNGKTSNYAWGASFARNGFVALAWDIVGEGERREYYDPITGQSRAERPTGDHSVAAYQSLVTGLPIATRFIRDAMRGVDFLASRSEVDPDRIGAFGCSGGGTMTAYLGALDPRVKAVGTACFVTDYQHLLATIGPQDAEQSIADYIAAGLDLADWVELAAPKPYAVISTTEDMFPFAGATNAVNEARRFWEIEGAADRFQWFTGPGPHGAIAPMGDKIIAFFRTALKPDTPAQPFARINPLFPERLDATSTGQISTALPGAQTMASLAAARAKAVSPKTPPDAATIRTAIRRLAMVSDTVPTATIAGDTLRIMAAAGPIDAMMIKPGGAANRAVLILGNDRFAAARAKSLAAAGALVVVLPPRGAGGNEEVKAGIVGDENLLGLRAMLVGKTLTGLRLDDALGALAWLRANVGGPVAIEGSGRTGPIALQAALLDEQVASVRIEASQISIRAAVDRLMQRDLPPIAVPGMLTAYDLPDVIAALAPRPVDILAPIDPLGNPLGKSGFAAVLGSRLAEDDRIRYSSNRDTTN